jgi:Kef-type K+ transport system membrane component KefB
VSPVLVFVGLLGVAFMGGLGRRGTNSLGLGAEYLVAGVIVGPAILGLVNRDTLQGFVPLIVMGLGWLAAVVGLRHGTHENTFVGRKIYGSAFLVSVVNVILLAGAAYLLARKTGAFGPSEATVLAVLIGGSLSVPSDGGVHPGLTKVHPAWRIRSGLGNSAMFPPLIALSLVIAFSPPQAAIAAPGWAWALGGPAVGVVFGVTVAALLGSKLHYAEFWPVFVGAVLLSSGLALRLRVPLVSTAFAVGLCVAALSPLRSKVRALTQKTEGPLLLPLVVLGGALVVWPTTRSQWELVFALVGLRLAIHYLTGRVLARAFRAEVPGGHELSMSLLPLGNLGLAVALGASFRQPGLVGSTVLLSACLVAVFGDLLGARPLERLFARNAELEASKPPPAESRPDIPGEDLPSRDLSEKELAHE